MHLRYCLMTANMDCKEMRHAQIVMKELGISYQHATPQSMSESWQFWNCENVPDPLPPYLSQIDADPLNYIGYGLSKADAVKIKNYKKSEDSAQEGK